MKTLQKITTCAVGNPDVECKSEAFAGGHGGAVVARGSAGSAGATQKRRFCTPHVSFWTRIPNRTGRKIGGTEKERPAARGGPGPPANPR